MPKPSEYYEKLTYGGNAFTPAKVKIKRARYHLDELRAVANDLPKMRPYYFVLGNSANLGTSTRVDIIYMPSNDMPMEFSGCIGDVVHNVRVALDYAAIALGCPPHGSGDPNATSFPTGINASSFQTNVEKKMRGVTRQAKQLIQELEPYPGGIHSIRELHELDIRDKHKLIVIAASKLRVEGLEVRTGGELKRIVATDFQPNSDGSNFTATIEYPGTAAPEKVQLGNFNASFDVVFGKGFPLEGEPVAQTLSKLCNTVSDFLIRCESLFP